MGNTKDKSARVRRKIFKVRRILMHRNSILLNNPRLQAEGFSICRLEGDSCFRHSGGSRNPGGLEVEPKTNLDAGVRRHDELSRRLKARDFTIPDRDVNLLK
jgi:hypothetical protein